jgi:hypothetical protein
MGKIGGFKEGGNSTMTSSSKIMPKQKNTAQKEFSLSLIISMDY